MSKTPRFLAFLLPLLAACSSSGERPEEAASGVLVVLHDYKTGQDLELASETHTDRVAFYSATRTNAARKVQSDEVMSAFVEQLDSQGFEDHAQDGRAPRVASGDVIRWGLEVERGGQREHWLIGTHSAPEHWKTFQECRDTFVQLYNITVSFQAVQNDSGAAFFGEGEARAATGKKR